VNAAFFGLAFLAALNPKLLAVDLLLIENRRPRTMFLCLLAGGLGMAIELVSWTCSSCTPTPSRPRGSASAGLDLALGVPLLAIGALLAAGRLHGRRRPAGSGAAPRPLVIVPYTFLELRPEGTKRQAQGRPGLDHRPRPAAHRHRRDHRRHLHDSHRPDPADLTSSGAKHID